MIFLRKGCAVDAQMLVATDRQVQRGKKARVITHSFNSVPSLL